MTKKQIVAIQAYQHFLYYIDINDIVGREPDQSFQGEVYWAGLKIR